ncbi:MAG: N-acetylmuramoyl-L-alanine amidase [Bacteroidaceae bacterium]|nr:N-acetylmuramoyl-L-alanine amidase [Bacteroidaceae bacterium]
MKKRFLLFLVLLPMLIQAHGLRPLVWVLDAGHGGRDNGCEGIKSLEKDINLEITKELAKLLKSSKPGIRLILTREKDEFLSLEQRCNIANQANADLFVSIHVNYAIGKPLLKGTETYYASLHGMTDAVLLSSHTKNADKSELLAWLMQKSYKDAGRETSRGVKPERLYVLTHTMMPAVLTEIGFMSNLEEEVYMNTKKGRKEIAQCICNALIDYYTTTQAKTHKKTLKNLRNTNGTFSGLKTEKMKNEPKQAEKQEEKPVEEPVKENLQNAPPVESVEPTPAQEQPAVEDQVNPDMAVQTPPAEPQTAPAEEKVESIDEEPPTPSIPVFSIQLFATSKELKATDAQLQGLGPVTYVKADNMFKCLYGGTTDYQQARKTLTEVREKFPDAFIVAYLGDKSITTAEALEMQR